MATLWVFLLPSNLFWSSKKKYSKTLKIYFKCKKFKNFMKIFQKWKIYNINWNVHRRGNGKQLRIFSVNCQNSIENVEIKKGTWELCRINLKKFIERIFSSSGNANHFWDIFYDWFDCNIRLNVKIL